MKKYIFVLVFTTFVWLTSCQERPAKVEGIREAAPVAMSIAPTRPPTEPDHCADCHTDQDRLISTAKPEEIVEAESTGAG